MSAAERETVRPSYEFGCFSWMSQFPLWTVKDFKEMVAIEIWTVSFPKASCAAVSH